MRELAKAVTPTSSEGQDAAALAQVAMTGCADSLGKRFDSTLGGFGGAPKFPRPCEMNALLRQYLRKQVIFVSSTKYIHSGKLCQVRMLQKDARIMGWPEFSRRTERNLGQRPCDLLMICAQFALF